MIARLGTGCGTGFSPWLEFGHCERGAGCLLATACQAVCRRVDNPPPVCQPAPQRKKIAGVSRHDGLYGSWRIPTDT
jgi:hypothetical protein